MKRLAFIFILILVIGCGKDGPMGPIGPAGPKGDTGTTGGGVTHTTYTITTTGANPAVLSIPGLKASYPLIEIRSDYGYSGYDNWAWGGNIMWTTDDFNGALYSSQWITAVKSDRLEFWNLPTGYTLTVVVVN
jgi:hypothetical protein